MQVKILNKNDIVEKSKTRVLYEECFDAGKNEYINYYYDTIIKRNEMVVVESENEVLSMVHLNPYYYNVFGKVTLVHYLVAISTKKEFRNKGLSKLVINEAINYLKQKKELFCYLVPDNESLINMYKTYGFDIVCDFSYNKFSKCSYDIFPDENEEYLQLMKTEQKFLELESEEYKEDLKKKKVMFKILNDDFRYSLSELKSKKIYVCQEV